MAAQIVTGQVNFTANFAQTPAGLLVTTPYNQLISDVLQYINSTGVNYGVDQLYAEVNSLASTTQTIHFETATAKDIFGNTLAMLRIRELIIQNTETTLSHILKVYSPSSNGITWLPPVANFLTVPPGGVLRISDPLSFGGGVGNVVGATSDGLTLDSASNTVGFKMMVLGCTVA
jgi:hypothetical protein